MGQTIVPEINWPIDMADSARRGSHVATTADHFLQAGCRRRSGGRARLNGDSMRRAITTFALLAMVMQGCERMVTDEQTYHTYDAAARADAIGNHRWIAPYLPKGATEIRIRFNGESNETWLSFAAPSSEVAAMLGACSRVASRDVKPPRYLPGGWPAELVSAGGSASEYEYYSCRSSGFVAVDPKRGRVYDWQFAR